jgi:gliding motility-associated-like protein
LNGSALTDNEMVEFTPLAGTLTASVTEIIADGISSSTLTVMLRNSGNNPVAGATVTMASTAGKLSSVTDNSDGTYVAILTSSPTPEKAVISYAVFGITGSQTVEVVFSARGLFIPEGFSPDGDGKNDTFIIQGAENFMISLTVYNRWGNIVYESKDYKNDWDGLANHGIVIGDKLPDGTYYYVVDLNNGNKPFVRFMTIKRK